MPSSSAASPRKKRGARKTLARGWWKAFWPVLIGIIITPFTVRLAGILALEGPKAFALLYPWFDVLRSRVLHSPADLVGHSYEYMLYLQFPLYGLLMTFTFRAGRHLRAIIIGLLAHFTGLLLVIVLAYIGQMPQ
ncbi:MAG TPA: hypothetical protein VL990_02285 [Acidobacteriaceae bacterium]|nr:hypothetical protein [Acidobacteriaceae bacterium]